VNALKSWPEAAWQWTTMLPAEGSVPWNQPGRYALRVVGDALHPRYLSGEYLIVREDGPPQPGSDVLVVLADGTAMIRELAAVRDGSVSLNTLKGQRQTIPQATVKILQQIVGRADEAEVFHVPLVGAANCPAGEHG
jgi:SOS-response transcriptional repressor LexA